MSDQVHYFGIRHHGPGSARRLIEALDALQPSEVLIEGPADASGLLPMLAHNDMQPPVALLAYAADAPEENSFWPFADYSPELQATRWAVRNGRPVRFIDLPLAWRHAKIEEPEPANDAPEVADDNAPDSASDDSDSPDDDTIAADDTAADDTADDDTLRFDPIGALAAAAGYEDGESWWQDVIEENHAPGPIFEAVADAMAALREAAPELDEDEARREAHMRLEIKKSLKQTDGPIAVVCGAWHVPALTAKHSLKDDRALLKGAPKRKMNVTWAPWTSPRLAIRTGYGAGVTAPGWCQHLWDTPPAERTTKWLVRTGRALRASGQIVSTASVIEAERLATSLAAVRNRPAPGFEELRDATIATLCFGERVLWNTVAAELLVGSDVGSIPDDVPLAPLLEDLQRQQKKARLKPAALQKELSLDLRSDSGLRRSTLLHRLRVLNVPWGQQTGAGKSRGTFRENWIVQWEPEYAVELVEHLIYGPTIEQAANGRMRALLKDATQLGELADLVSNALTAQLPDAADAGITLVEHRAGQTSDCLELLTALPPMADIIRYGQAREIDSAKMEHLFVRIALAAGIALPYAGRNLDKDAAATFRDALLAANDALILIGQDDTQQDQWHRALDQLLNDAQSSRLLAGTAARLLYEAEKIPPERTADLIGKNISPGTAVADAAAFFEGFFEGGGQRLIHDEALRGAVDTWIGSLEVDNFIEHLPLFRRVFSSLDAMERKRLLDALFGRKARTMPGLQQVANAQAIWAAQFARISDILTAESAK